MVKRSRGRDGHDGTRDACAPHSNCIVPVKEALNKGEFSDLTCRLSSISQEVQTPDGVNQRFPKDEASSHRQK